MKNEITTIFDTPNNMGNFEPMKQEFKKKILTSNGIIDSLPENLRKVVQHKEDISAVEINSLLSFSSKPEDWLEICYFSERKKEIDHEELWISGLEKYNGSALYLENLGYFYYQRGKYHKSLEYLSRSHALENSFFALSLAIAAAYALTQYHLVLDYFFKFSAKDKNKINEDVLMKVATAAMHQQQYDLSVTIFQGIQKKINVTPLPDLESFLENRFETPELMRTWSGDMEQKAKSINEASDISIDDSITYASILIHENKFEKALNYLTEVKKIKFKN